MVKPISKAIKNNNPSKESILSSKGGISSLKNPPLLVTLDTPTDPFDCSRYPNSIYCEGNPFNALIYSSTGCSLDG
jgi:hypothetical protein